MRTLIVLLLSLLISCSYAMDNDQSKNDDNIKRVAIPAAAVQVVGFTMVGRLPGQSPTTYVGYRLNGNKVIATRFRRGLDVTEYGAQQKLPPCDYLNMFKKLEDLYSQHCQADEKK